MGDPALTNRGFALQRNDYPAACGDHSDYVCQYALTGGFRMACEPTFLGIVAGDWLQAGATVFAVVGTILGTLHIERKKREAGTQENVSRISEVVTAIATAAGAIRAGLPDDPTNFDDYARSLSMQTALKTALDMYHFVRADTKVKDLKLWRALKTLDEALSNHGKTVENELRIFNADGHHTEVFNINREKVMAASIPIDTAAKGVLAHTE